MAPPKNENSDGFFDSLGVIGPGDIIAASYGCYVEVRIDFSNFFLSLFSF